MTGILDTMFILDNYQTWRITKVSVKNRLVITSFVRPLDQHAVKSTNPTVAVDVLSILLPSIPYYGSNSQ